VATPFERHLYGCESTSTVASRSDPERAVMLILPGLRVVCRMARQHPLKAWRSLL
jgi:hypothetical protein